MRSWQNGSVVVTSNHIYLNETKDVVTLSQRAGHNLTGLQNQDYLQQYFSVLGNTTLSNKRLLATVLDDLRVYEFLLNAFITKGAITQSFVRKSVNLARFESFILRS
jgi:hypothetical protein